MKNLLIYIIKTSRPRFWSYILGPFLIGLAFLYREIGLNIFKWQFLILLIYFSFPFNFLMYSVNDYFDRDTDERNPKKITHETKFISPYKKIVYVLWFVIGVLTVLTSLFILNETGRIWFLLLIGLSLFYSIPPLNFKRRTFIDSISNIFYIFPGYVVYAIQSGNFNPFVFLFLACWPMAMHLYSAIPDIKSDKKAGINTTAVLLGEKRSLSVCFLLWLIFSSGLSYINLIFSPLIIYAVIPFISFFGFIPVSRFYWYFPVINTIIGFIYFWTILVL